MIQCIWPLNSVSHFWGAVRCRAHSSRSSTWLLNMRNQTYETESSSDGAGRTPTKRKLGICGATLLFFFIIGRGPSSGCGESRDLITSSTNRWFLRIPRIFTIPVARQTRKRDPSEPGRRPSGRGTVTTKLLERSRLVIMDGRHRVGVGSSIRGQILDRFPVQLLTYGVLPAGSGAVVP